MKLNLLIIKEFFDNENVKIHLTKLNSHTGHSDAERFHNTIADIYRILYKLNIGLPVEQ